MFKFTLYSRQGPSSWNQRIWLSFLSAITGSIALYMGFYQWGLISHVWDPAFGRQTEAVLSSNVSHILYQWFRMPDAVLGSITYFGDVIFALAGSSKRWMDRPWLVLLFGLYVIPPAVVSIILVIIQGTVLSKWCFLCIITAVISVALILLAYTEVWISLLFLCRVWKKNRNLFWGTLWGKPSETAHHISRTIEAEYFGAVS